MMRLILTYFLSALVFAVPVTVSAKQKTGRWGEVKEAAFGEVLYDYFQGRYFSAITTLLMAEAQGSINHHRQHADLLMIGMAMSYGMHDYAAERLFSLGKTAEETGIQDRIHFFIGKMKYQKGVYDEAVAELASIKQRLPDELEQEKAVLLANMAMKQNRVSDAISALKDVKGGGTWAIYGQYNLGVALVRSGKHETGRRFLASIGNMGVYDEETRALRDRANLALGYDYIRYKDSQKAQSHLKKVRLNGPSSNKALLGLGWAYAAEEKYEKALVYWQELNGRNIIDPAVQESVLAVPYALANLGRTSDAVSQYNDAIKLFETENERLQYAVRAIRQGKLNEQLLKLDPGSEKGWYWSLKTLPDSPESRYLSALLATHEFQETLKNYRDVRFLQQGIRKNTRDYHAVKDLLAYKSIFYQKKARQLSTGYLDSRLGRLLKKRDSLASEIARIESGNNINELASEDESRKLNVISRLNARSGESDKVRLRVLQGTILWNMYQQRPERLWRLKSDMKTIDDKLATISLKHKLISGKGTADALRYDNRGFKGEGLRLRLDTALKNANQLERELADKLRMIAISGLKQQQQRLATYLTQARFGLAQIYDKALESRGR